jgi:hypothetical protein
MSAPPRIISRAFSSKVRTTRAGAPTTSELSGKVLPSVITAPAPTMQFVPMREPFIMIAPMPTRLSSPIVQPCRMTL